MTEPSAVTMTREESAAVTSKMCQIREAIDYLSCTVDFEEYSNLIPAQCGFMTIMDILSDRLGECVQTIARASKG